MMLNWLKILTELQKALPNRDGPFRVAVYMRSDLMVHQAATAKRHIESLEKEVNAQSKFVTGGNLYGFWNLALYTSGSARSYGSSDGCHQWRG